MTPNETIVRQALTRSGPGQAYARRLIEPGRLTPWRRADIRRIAATAGRILALIEAAPAEQFEAGKVWYAQALAETEAEANGRIPTALAIAIVAAVSPGLAWDRNVPALGAILEHALTGRPLAEATKARSIGLGKPGWTPWYHALHVLRTGPQALTGPKRQAFAEGIATAGQTVAVAVDGHAALAASGPAPSRSPIAQAPALSVIAYDRLAASYATVGHVLGLTPAQAQAIAWVAWRSIPTKP